MAFGETWKVDLATWDHKGFQLTESIRIDLQVTYIEILKILLDIACGNIDVQYAFQSKHVFSANHSGNPKSEIYWVGFMDSGFLQKKIKNKKK